MRDRLTENETPKTSTATDPFALAGVLVNPCPGSSFCPRLPAAGGYFTPPPWHISSSRAHSNKIPTAVRMFSGSNFLMVPLPVLRDVDIRHKSKMAVAKKKCTYFMAV